MKDKKLAASLADAARHLRKCADIIDKAIEADANEGDGEKKAKRRRICD